MHKAPLLIALILLSTPIAGCLETGDGPGVEVSQEDLQYLFDENFEDFMNNTSITVNQNINHYNNTTIQQPSTLKSSSGTMAGVETVENYPSGLSLLVREDAYAAADAGNSVAGLNGANICVGIGTVMEGDLVDYFSDNGISFTSVPVADSAEATAKFIDGSCDAMAIASRALAEEKNAQLDADGSMNGVAIWVSSLHEWSIEDSPGVMGNSMSIIISQSDEEMISGLHYLFVQVDIMVTCSANSTNCTDFSETLEPGNVELISSCSHGVSFSWSSIYRDTHLTASSDEKPWGQFEGYGLNCTHSLNFHVSQVTGNIDGLDREVHELSWGDWVYSAVWESTPIE